MSTAPARRAHREQPPPASGTVEVRVHGAREDVEAYLRQLGTVLPVGEYTWRLRQYPAKTGGVLLYLKVNLPSRAAGS
ncbi:hypothetical protein [Spirillospora sp. NBC_01491]|uniref:hypothetical protein n=1 Tax=Spirillospora sp. NBC_01491 TaxID=2976007 RepID=UPI002E2FFE8D|nr:hypothetical protein [Spirillospora sp. NBC_01491]